MQHRGRKPFPVWAPLLGGLLGLSISCASSGARLATGPLVAERSYPNRKALTLQLDLRPIDIPASHLPLCVDPTVPTSGDAGTFGTEDWLAQFPDSLVVRAPRDTRDVLLVLWTPKEASSVHVWIGYPFTYVVDQHYRKPAGQDRLILSWSLADSSLRRVPGGFYAVGATVGATTNGGVVILEE